MSFNSKQIKTIKFLLIIVVILLVLFTAYVFLGKKMIEGYEYDGGEGGSWLSDNTSIKQEVTYDWRHVINPTQYPAYVSSRGLTGQLTPPPYDSSNIPRNNETPAQLVTYDWRHVINPTQYPAYVSSRGLTGQLTPPPYDSSNIPRNNETPAQLVTYNWSHVINPTQYPAYVSSRGLTGQLTPPPYDSSNIPRNNEAPVINTPAPVINTPAPVINTPAPANKNTPATYDREYDEKTSAPALYDSGAYEKTSAPAIVNKTPSPLYDWSHVVNAYMYPEYVNSIGVTQQPNRPPYDSSNIPSKKGETPVNNTPVTTDPVTYDWTSWRAMNSSIPETTLVTTYSYDATKPINKQPNKWPGHPSVAALTTDPVTYDWSNWLAINSGVSQATLTAYGYNTSKLITAQPNKWPGHPNLAPLGGGGAGGGAGGAGAGGGAGGAGATGATGATGANVYLLPSSFSAGNSNYSLYGNNNLLQQQQRLLQQTQSQLQQSQLEQEQQRWQSRLQGQSPTEPVMNTNNIKGSSNAPKKKICYAPYKNEKDCENAGYLWDSMKEKCRKSDTNKSRTNDKSSADTNSNKNNYFNSYNSYNNDDKYILKTQIVPPVCPACPSYKCASEPQKLDNSIQDQDTNNDLLTANNMILNERNFAKSIKTNDSGRFPMPLLADFSQFM